MERHSIHKPHLRAALCQTINSQHKTNSVIFVEIPCLIVTCLGITFMIFLSFCLQVFCIDVILSGVMFLWDIWMCKHMPLCLYLCLMLLLWLFFLPLVCLILYPFVFCFFVFSEIRVSGCPEWPRTHYKLRMITLSSRSCYLHLRNAGITGMCTNHAWLMLCWGRNPGLCAWLGEPSTH